MVYWPLVLLWGMQTLCRFQSSGQHCKMLDPSWNGIVEIRGRELLWIGCPSNLRHSCLDTPPKSSNHLAPNSFFNIACRSTTYCQTYMDQPPKFTSGWHFWPKPLVKKSTLINHKFLMVDHQLFNHHQITITEGRLLTGGTLVMINHHWSSSNITSHDP